MFFICRFCIYIRVYSCLFMCSFISEGIAAQLMFREEGYICKVDQLFLH